MQASKLDILLSAAFVVALFSLNWGGYSDVYLALRAKLDSCEKVVPGVLLNPLGSFATVESRLGRSQPTGADKVGGDEASDDSRAAESEGEDAEAEEANDDAEDEARPAREKGDNSLESRVKASKEAAAEALEEMILDLKLEDARANRESVILLSEKRFLLDFTDTKPSQLLDTRSFNREELAYLSQLESTVEEWVDSLKRIERLAGSAGSGASSDETEQEAVAEDSLEAKLVDDLIAWENEEFSRLRDEARKEMRFSLSGVEVTEADVAAVERTKKLLEQEKRGTTAASQASSEESPENSLHESFSGGNAFEDPAGFLPMLTNLEQSISLWAHASEKKALIFGNAVYVGRDLELYTKVLQAAGYAIERRKKEGALSTSMILDNDFPLLLCLALKNDDCFSSAGIAKLKPYQRINRIPGLRAVLWSKDSFCKTVNAGTKGEPMFSNYIFNCWLFPISYPQAKEYAEQHPDESFIVKPLTMGGGRGISVVDGAKGLHDIRFKTQIVQNYLATPHLIDGRKWDMRTYILVTSVVPMRAYIYPRGLARFASSLYDPNAKRGGKKSQFLTNTSINKKYVNNNVTNIVWSFETLADYFEKQQAGTWNALLKRMQIAVSVVMLSAEQEWRRYYASRGESCDNCFQIMGVDLILDAAMNARVIEVNGQPSMKFSDNKDDHYSVTKMKMVSEMLHIIVGEKPVAEPLLRALSQVEPMKLKLLKKNDWLYLLEYMKERTRRGAWLKVYPNLENSELHSAFLERQKHNPARLALHDVLMILEKATEETESQ